MKYIKGLAIATAALFALAACSEKYDEWKPGDAETGSQFYFSNTTTTQVTLTPATTSIDVPLYRLDTSASSAATVSVSEEETQYIIESSPATFNVAFDAGSNVATLSIPVDMDKVPFGKSAKLNLAITSAETTQYAVSNISITATLPEPWKNLGKGLWVDDIICGLYSLDPITVPCTIYENELTPGVFKVEGFQLPLAAQILGASESTMKNYEGTYWRNSPIVIDASDPNNVTIALQDYGVCINTKDGFVDGVTSVYKGSPFSIGTYADGIISFPTPKGMLCTLNGAYYYADQHGKFAVVMPGVELSDYTIGLTLEGILTDSEGTDNALVSVDFIGANAEKAAVVLVKGGDEDAIDYALDLVFVEDESVVIIDKPGMVKLPFAADAEGGKYTVVAVPISDKGQQDDYAVYATVQYGLGPFEIAYTEDDLLAGVPKATLLGTNWIMWATDDEGAATDREPYSIVTFEDADDKIIGGDECDIVKVSGIDYGVGQKAGFDGTLEMEWYSGAIYMIGNPSAGEVVLSGTTYTIKPVVMDYTTFIYSTGNYGMYAAYVADGLVAFVNNSSLYDYTGIEFAAFDSEDTYQGYFACANYIILADPAVYPLNYSAPAAVQKAKETLVKLQAKKYQMYKGDSPRNYVELPMGPVQQGVRKAPVVASGKAHASKELGDAQSQRANL